ncbi:MULTISPECIES: Fur family transcriptional regulator [Parabacteroides]|uniref:Ferric uptake regulation protein n=1 Tax=Parabacteroides chinchillae TaxID=871327 RepID=A0A8G2BUR9_9BACT|nr:MULTISPECIES: transcriptional repressor [Parabacteroides]SEF60379.1 Fur family transcriptional regulator, ferric uptake regulator [Parabacteroides chinchillae]
MEAKEYTEMQTLFTEYLTDKKLRKTEERYTILKYICAFPGHFDMCMLHQQLEDGNFHVSKATLYNTLEVLVDAGLIVRHQVNTKVVQYELRLLADTHLHLVCTKCGAIREVRNNILKADLDSLKISRFTPEYYSLYIYGICSKCKYKYKMQKLSK